MHDVVWMYWEGPVPPYIALCIETARHHAGNVRLLDRQTFDDLFREDRHLPIDELAVNHRSDFVRAYLLNHYGGLYLDADCIVMRPLAPLLELARERGFVGYREPQGYASCNLMASVPQSPVIARHYARVREAVGGGRALDWLDLASVPLDATLRELPGAAYELPTSLVMPLAWNESEQLAIRRGDSEHEEHFEPHAFCYMLSNNTIKSRESTRMFLYMPRRELLSQHSFLSFLFRKALFQTPIDKPWVPDHLGGHEDKTLMDEGALDYLAEHFGVRTLVDVGCGPGGMVFYALQKGIRAVGVDGDASLARASHCMIEHDFSQKPLYAGEFDLGWATEFVEHIDEQFVPNFMATLEGCKHVFITAAVPGQQGHHHVNCRDSDYWIAHFADYGFGLDEEATAGARRHSSMASRFTEQTGLVFTRLNA